MVCLDKEKQSRKEFFSNEKYNCYTVSMYKYTFMFSLYMHGVNNYDAINRWKECALHIDSTLM